MYNILHNYVLLNKFLIVLQASYQQLVLGDLTDLSSTGQTSVRQADPGPAQEQRTRGFPGEGGCRRREGSAERRHQSLSA